MQSCGWNVYPRWPWSYIEIPLTWTEPAMLNSVLSTHYLSQKIPLVHMPLWFNYAIFFFSPGRCLYISLFCCLDCKWGSLNKMFSLQKKQVIVTQTGQTSQAIIFCYASVGAPGQAHLPVQQCGEVVPPTRLQASRGQAPVSFTCSARPAANAQWVSFLCTEPGPS